jgi:hypothetical protein
MGVEGQKGGGEGKRKGSRVNRSKKHYMTVWKCQNESSYFVQFTYAENG